jgi:hypothetical protein
MMQIYPVQEDPLKTIWVILHVIPITALKELVKNCGTADNIAPLRYVVL